MGIENNPWQLPAYQVGDLVTFCGYSYSPDYVYIDASDESLGIITNAIRTATVHEYFTYKIFWFKTMQYTEAIGAHLRLVSS